MNEFLRFFASFVVGLIVVETVVYCFNKWIVDDLSPPPDSPDKYH